MLSTMHVSAAERRARIVSALACIMQANRLAIVFRAHAEKLEEHCTRASVDGEGVTVQAYLTNVVSHNYNAEVRATMQSILIITVS